MSPKAICSRVALTGGFQFGLIAGLAIIAFIPSLPSCATANGSGVLSKKMPLWNPIDFPQMGEVRRFFAAPSDCVLQVVETEMEERKSAISSPWR